MREYLSETIIVFFRLHVLVTISNYYVIGNVILIHHAIISGSGNDRPIKFAIGREKKMLKIPIIDRQIFILVK